MPKLRNGRKVDSNPGSLDCESGILSRSYRVAQMWMNAIVEGCTGRPYNDKNQTQHDTDKATRSSRDNFGYGTKRREDINR